jgi:phosphoribosylamine--glycine ligase
MAALGIECVPGPPEAVGADLYVIGPEAPLVDGLADRLRHAGALVFGPGADGARLEGSKAWMKDLLSSAGVPTASYGSFTESGPALEFLGSLAPPWVVKTDGLAAGKGVLVTHDLDEAAADVRAKLSGRSFGDAGRRVVIEEGLTGAEISVMAICDGTRALALAPAQDYKRIGEGDTGPNTGGMGACSPVPGLADGLLPDVMKTAVTPTLDALSAGGIDYRGVLYAGLMLTPHGLRVLEFNVRFGDPETQVVLPRWDDDVAQVLAAAAAGRLDDVAPPRFSGQASVCVILAAPGYPDAVRTGQPIHGIKEATQLQGIELYAAGISAGPDGGLQTSGGRVLGVGATGPHVDDARRRAYEAVSHISWDGMAYRPDIAVLAGAKP